MNWLGGLGLAGCMSYSLLLFFIIRAGVQDETHLLLAISPLVLLGGWVAWRSVPGRWRTLLLLGIGTSVAAMIASHALWHGLIATDGLWHAAMNIFMLWLFARTLLRGRVPLISGVAQQLEGADLSPAVARYTRRVTLAWSLFFAAQLLCSAVLFLFAPLSIWSFFVNVLNGPLIALMFVVEYGVRLVFHPAQARNTIPRVIGAFSRQIAATGKK